MLWKKIKSNSNKDLSVFEHLDEFRQRIIYIVVYLVLFSIIGFFLSDFLLKVLTSPLGSYGKLIFTKPAEAMVATLKISAYFGFLATIPVILFNTWRFISPALPENQRKKIFWIIPISCFLFLGGVAFSYYLVLPFGLKFLLQYGTQRMEALITISAYVSFVLFFLLSFGVIFQFPLVIIILKMFGLVDAKMLSSVRKYAIFIIFVLAGVITPTTDIFTQCLMAFPMLALYELSILIIRFI